MLMAAAGQGGRGQYDHGVDRHGHFHHRDRTGAGGSQGAEPGLELSKSTFSHHLRIMREAGLLDSVITADDPALV
jgi:DNA-binding transcriptional ArsR family regulator